MNITPALPNPHQLPADRDNVAVAAVRKPNRTRDAVDQPGPRELRPQRISPSGRERLAAQADILLDRPDAATTRASRALASYAAVADSGESGGLRELLGFDAYA